jgi:iron complex transport system substrate-binding protein
LPTASPVSPDKEDHGMVRTPSPARRAASAVAVALTLALLAGCSAPAASSDGATTPAADQSVPLADLDLSSDPRTVEGPSTALLQNSSVEAITENPEQTLPATVTSHERTGDVQVTVDSTDRILGLDISGSIAATIFGLGLGDSVVGRDISTTFPEAEDLPLITSGGHSVNSEAVLALRPTVLITDGTIGPLDVVLQLREAGIAVVFVDTEPSMDGVGELARQVSAALGVAPAGELLAASLATQIADKTAEIAAIAPQAEGDRLRILFLYLRGGSGIYYLFGEESGVDELITAVGGIDVAGEIGWTGMKPMTDEALVAGNPDLILVMSDGIESAGGVDGLIETKPAIGLTNAGLHRRFVDMADGEVLSFGPRTPQVLDALARAIYAPQ